MIGIGFIYCRLLYVSYRFISGVIGLCRKVDTWDKSRLDYAYDNLRFCIPGMREPSKEVRTTTKHVLTSFFFSGWGFGSGRTDRTGRWRVGPPSEIRGGGQGEPKSRQKTNNDTMMLMIIIIVA